MLFIPNMTFQLMPFCSQLVYLMETRQSVHGSLTTAIMPVRVITLVSGATSVHIGIFPLIKFSLAEINTQLFQELADPSLGYIPVIWAYSDQDSD